MIAYESVVLLALAVGVAMGAVIGYVARGAAQELRRRDDIEANRTETEESR